MVTVLLFGLTLRDSVGESKVEVDVRGPVTVKNLIETGTDKLTCLLAFMNKGELLVTVNRKVGSMDSIVKDGDTVKLTHQSNPIYEGAMWQNP
jgi:sulfur-carrier protein